MQKALEAGEVLPPVVADKKSKVVVDGFHRTLVVLRKGPNALIEVLFRPYKNRAEMLLDAMRLNSAHGEKLSSYDKARSVALAEEFKLAPEVVAAALRMTVEQVADLRMRKTAIDPDQKLIPIKLPLRRFAGQQLTASQIEGNQRAGGMSQLYMINQVINLIEHNLIDTASESVRERLAHLAKLLAKFVKKDRVA
jgi:hypothetical protein